VPEGVDLGMDSNDPDHPCNFFYPGKDIEAKCQFDMVRGSRVNYPPGFDVNTVRSSQQQFEGAGMKQYQARLLLTVTIVRTTLLLAGNQESTQVETGTLVTKTKS